MNKQIIISLIALLSGVASATAGAVVFEPASINPADVKPLAVGVGLPDVTVYNAKGEPVQLRELVGDSRAVIVFYRGGWCPYCNTHLAALGEMEEELTAAGYTIYAISPDRVEKVAEAAGESDFSYVLLSDSSTAAARAFGLAFTIDDETNKFLLGHGIDLNEASGKSHRQLPVPAVFLVDEKGVVIFRHHDPDYSQRLSSDVLRAVVENKK